mmetsp:Transcript_42753/g.84012  ORF Transcript_42753/g.84012 Transcript_42753/m.84012 type:complete len:230 (-) Transcript_42753:178-867(-)
MGSFRLQQYWLALVFLEGCTITMGAKLFFYYSSMNAGKSTTLLQSNYNYKERGMNTILYTPEIDDRAGVGVIKSRLNISAKATAFHKDFDLFADVRSRHSKNTPISCVLVDEAQFLNQKQVLQLTLVCDRLNIPVLCYGIRTDFLGEPFEGSKYLLAWAEQLVEIKAICKTGAKATFNARFNEKGEKVLEGAQTQIGVNYEAMSRRAFNLLEATPCEYEIPPENDNNNS